jgi:hypothetical protein
VVLTLEKMPLRNVSVWLLTRQHSAQNPAFRLGIAPDNSGTFPPPQRLICATPQSAYAFMKTKILAAFLSACLLAPAAFAQDKPDAPAADEAAIRAFIKQLGDNEWKTREAAANKLKEIGEPALPLLKELLESKDLDLKSRAEELVKTIEGASPIKHEVKIAAPQGFPKQDVVFESPDGVAITVGNEGKTNTISVISEMEFKEAGREYWLMRNYDGKTATITIEVTETKDGKEDTQTHKFESEVELEKKSPDLAKLYKKRFGDIAQKQEQLRKQFSEMTGIP